MNYKKVVGNFGEELAIKYLEKKGYKIIARNKNLSHQELDIVAIIGNKIVFFEVKTRTNNNYGSAEEAIDERKMRNLKKAIVAFTVVHGYEIDNVQLDIIAVNINKANKIANIKHYMKIL